MQDGYSNNRVETERVIPKLKFVSIKLKPQDVESSSIGTALGSYRNYTHIWLEFQYGKETVQTTTEQTCY